MAVGKRTTDHTYTAWQADAAHQSLGRCVRDAVGFDRGNLDLPRRARGYESHDATLSPFPDPGLPAGSNGPPGVGTNKGIGNRRPMANGARESFFAGVPH